MRTWPASGPILSVCAVVMWAIGIVLYVVLVAVIVVRWLSIPLHPAALGPAQWILMGACAISVLAGARLVALPSSLGVRVATAGFVQGLSLVVWSVGSFWIPLLIAVGWWRHAARHVPLAYATGLWSIVFPLGMYSAATGSFAAVAHYAFMRPIAHVALWVAVSVWVAVLAAGVVAATRRATGAGARTAVPVVGRTAVDHSV